MVFSRTRDAVGPHVRIRKFRPLAFRHLKFSDLQEQSNRLPLANAIGNIRWRRKRIFWTNRAELVCLRSFAPMLHFVAMFCATPDLVSDCEHPTRNRPTGFLHVAQKGVELASKGISYDAQEATHVRAPSNLNLKKRGQDISRLPAIGPAIARKPTIQREKKIVIPPCLAIRSLAAPHNPMSSVHDAPRDKTNPSHALTCHRDGGCDRLQYG
jgi:hypothetical protein